MITYFPTIYPDELLYSQLARFYTKSGYLAYTFAAEDLFQSKTVRPDIEFVNAYTPEALQMITRSMSMEEVVMHHTMFPYYGRFIKPGRRQKAFQSLVSTQGNYHNLLAIPTRKDGSKRHLRYCPICAEKDRHQYGETYWHRVHQLTGVNICPSHLCNLINSNVVICGNASPSLIAAENCVEIPCRIKYSDNTLECRLAEYIAEVFHSDVDLQSEISVGRFLHSKMACTRYRSVRGAQRNIALLHKDFCEYYSALPNNWFSELWQIQKVLTDDRFNTYTI